MQGRWRFGKKPALLALSVSSIRVPKKKKRCKRGIIVDGRGLIASAGLFFWHPSGRFCQIIKQSPGE